MVADEGWRNGKKDGPSTRWFSNGVKMYERNYTEGKWNGTVTRWWPNGQKMYVRAYSDGVRHGEERATHGVLMVLLLKLLLILSMSYLVTHRPLQMREIKILQ